MQKNNYNIKDFMDYNWIYNGLKIQEDLVKIKEDVNKVKEKEVDQDKIDGEEMIDGQEDHYHIKEEAHPAIAEIKIFKLLHPNVQEIKCKFIFLFKVS